MTALLAHTLFVIAVLGTKVVIALWAIYYLFPADRSCPRCDAETFSVQSNGSQRLCGILLFLAKVHRRWCPECAWEGFARPMPSLRPVSPPPSVVDHAGRSLR